MKIENTRVVVGMETKSFRILWWKEIRFGPPSITDQFYGGPSTVMTWGGLWVEWTQGTAPHPHPESTSAR